MRAVNDIFVGPRSHTSALYELEHEGQREFQSSSGLIVSTGLGSTAWMKSVVTGSIAIARAASSVDNALAKDAAASYQPMPWDTKALMFAVREPFPSRASQASIVWGRIDASHPLRLRSRMPEGGVIFSDGVEADFLRFTAGLEASIGVAPVSGRLVV